MVEDGVLLARPFLDISNRVRSSGSEQGLLGIAFAPDFAAAVDPGGHNYGWNRTEGMHCYQQPSCTTDGLTSPVVEYDHGEGCSITGGVVYRGRRSPVLRGLYLFADYCSGRIWALAPGGSGGWQVARVGRVDGSPAAFGEDDGDEVYVADLTGGSLYRVTGRRATVEPRRGGRRLGP